MATPERLFPNASRSDIRTRFHLGKQLGQGGTGVVTVCSDLQTGIPVAACKSVPKSKLQRRDALEELQREVHANRRVRGHAHVVELRGLYEDAQAVHLVMDLCKGGDLYDFLIARSPVAEPVAAEIARQVLLALAHCHAVGVMHRDIKPENILLLAPDDGSGRVHVKLADFGLAVLLRPGQRAVGMYGSAIYMSPEVVCRRPYGHAVDLWGLGVIVYLALAGYMPFWGSTDEELFLRILRNSPDFRADPWPRVSPQAVDFIRSLLHSDPAHRPSALAALQHPWIVQHCGGPAASTAPSLSAEPMPGMTPKAPAATRKSAPAGESGAKVHPEAGKAQQLPRAGSMEASGEAAVVAPPSVLNKIRVGGAGQSGGQSAAHHGRAMDVDSDQSVPIAPVASASSAASAASAMPAPMKQPRQAPAGAQRQWPTQQVEAAQAQAQGGEEVQPLQRTRRTSQPREKREGRGKSTRGASAAEQQVRGRSRHRESATAPRAMDVDEQMPSQQSSQPSQASSQANHHASHALPPIQVPPAAGSAPSPSPSQGSSQAATPTAPATRPRASHFRFFSPKRKSRAATHVTVADAPSGDSTPMSFPSTPTYLPLDSPSASSAARGGESSRSTSSFMDAAPSCFPVFRRQSSSSSTPRSRTAKPSVITIPLRTQASATSASEVTTVEIPCIRTEPPLDPTKQPPSLPEMQARLSQPDGSLPVPELLSYLRPRPSSPRRAPAASADDSAPSSAASSAPQKRGFAKPAWMEAIRAAKPEDSLAGQVGAANGAASGGLPAGTDARRASSQFLASNPARKPAASAAGLAAGGGSAEKGSSRAGVSITIPADQPDSELRGQLEQHEQPREPREPRELKKKVRSPATRPAQPPESPSAIPLDSRQSPKPSPSSLVDPRQSPRLSSPRNPRAGGKLVPPLVLPMRGTCEAEKEKPLRRRDSAQRGAGTGEGAGGSASGGEESAYLSCKSPSASSVASSVTEGWSPFMSSAGSVSGSSNAGSGGSSPYHAETLTPALTSVLKMRAMVRVPVGGSAGQVAGQGGQDGQVEAGRQERKERKERKERSEKHERREKLERHGVHKSHMEVEGEGEEGGAAAAAVHMVASAEGADVVRSNGEHRTHSSSHSHGHSSSQSQAHGARKARGLGSIVRAFAALSTAQPDSGAGNGVTTAGSKSSSVPVTPVRNPFSSNVSSLSSSAKSASAHVASLRAAGATSAGLRASASVAAAAAAASANVGAPAAANASSYTNSSSSSAYSSGSGSAPPFRPPVPKWGEGGVGTGRVKGGALAEARAIIKQRQMLQQQQQQQQQQQGGDFGHGDGMVGLAPGGTWLASR
ncbi:unnamed protein product [Closterium sp. NIES-64]|nr:unnamed protein product [Closterium sp. NIES-64]